MLYLYSNDEITTPRAKGACENLDPIRGKGMLGSS